MMKEYKNAFAISLIGSLVVASAGAQVVYDNMIGGASGIASGIVSDATINQVLADDVSLASDTLVTGIEWTGIYFAGDNSPSVDDSFVITVYSDSVGAPGAALTSFAVGANASRSNSGETLVNGVEVYEYSASIAYTFLGGVDYWVSIENSYVGDSDLWAWGGGSTQIGSGALRTSDGVTWVNAFVGGMDFRLIPTPGTTPIVACVALVSTRRRR